MEMRDLLFFEKMIVPTIITFVYWLLLLACVIGGLVVMVSQSVIGGIVAIVFGCLGARVWCELLIVLFKINEALQEIRRK